MRKYPFFYLRGALLCISFFIGTRPEFMVGSCLLLLSGLRSYVHHRCVTLLYRIPMWIFYRRDM